MLPQFIADQIDEKQLHVGFTLHADGSGMQYGLGLHGAASGGGAAPPQPGNAHTWLGPHVVEPHGVVWGEPPLPPVPEPALPLEPPLALPLEPPLALPLEPPLALPLEPPLALPALPPAPAPPMPLADPQAGHNAMTAIAELLTTNASVFIPTSQTKAETLARGSRRCEAALRTSRR